MQAKGFEIPFFGGGFSGVFILPIFVISNFPPMFLLNKMSLAYLAWSALLLLILLLVVRVVWKQGLKNYNSASS